MPATQSMFCQISTTIDGKRGGMILPSTNQEEIVKEFLSELTFWGDLPMATESEHENRDESTHIKVQRDSSSDNSEARRAQSLKEVSKSPISTGIVWRTAVDPHSGRTYYYDAISRRTQWDKVRIKVSSVTLSFIQLKQIETARVIKFQICCH